MFRVTLAAAGLALALPVGAMASTLTLDFEGLPLTQGQQLTFTDFSTPEVTVSQGAYSGAMGDAGKDVTRNVGDGVLRYYDVDYVGLTDVAYVDPNASVGEFVFKPDAGYFVTLDSFKLSFFDDTDNPNSNFGSFPQTVDVEVFGVMGSSWTSLWKDTNVALNDNTAPVTFEPNARSSSELRLQWTLSGSGDIDAVGIDDITFTAAVIPLPAGLPLLLGALGVLGLLARRRQAA